MSLTVLNIKMQVKYFIAVKNWNSLNIQQGRPLVTAL